MFYQVIRQLLDIVQQLKNVSKYNQLAIICYYKNKITAYVRI